jgi:hypothetical protein
MEKEFVPYTLALRLKALGFDEPCLAMFTNRYRNGETYPMAIGQHEGSNISGDKNSDFDGQSFWYVTTPTFSQAFRWFREKYELFGHIEVESNNSFYWHIKNPEQFISSQKSNTYEEAELACLEKLIEIVEKR